MKKTIVTIILASALFSCKPNAEKASSFDVENAKKEIATANQSFEDFVSKSDSIGLATNCYTKDAKLMSPNSDIISGREALVSAFSSIFKSGITGIKLTTTEIWGDENTITEEGAMQLKIKDGTVVEKGKYLVIWKKEDGKWKLHRDCYNSNLPLAPSAK